MSETRALFSLPWRRSPERARVFKPNNHSEWRVGFRPIPEAEYERLKSVFTTYFSRYGRSVVSIMEVDGDEINNQNFKIRVQTEGGEQNYLLRRIGFLSTEAVQKRTEIVDKLVDRDVKVVQSLASDTGERVVIDLEERYQLFPFVEGDHYRGELSELTDAGCEIGKLDHALLELTPEYGDDESLQLGETYHETRTYSDEIWQEIFSKIEQSGASSNDPHFDRLVLSYKKEILDAVRAVNKSSLPQERQLMHIDLHPHNLLTNGSETQIILDQDAIYSVEKMRAVSFALHRLVRQYVLQSGRRDTVRAVQEGSRIFLKTYEAENPLTPAERAFIPSFIRDEALQRLTYVLKEYANSGSSPWANRFEIEKHIMSLREAEYFEEL